MPDGENSIQDSSLPEAQAYQVRLKVFEGPLDLLLHLIEKEELDITTVSLTAVADQYLEHIAQLEHVSAEALADFLVVAAKLLLIKSRALLPAPPRLEAEDEEDLGEELVRRLREYKKLKEAAQLLRGREEAGLRGYLRVAPLPRLERELDMTGVSIGDLVSAVREALSVEPPLASADRVIGAPIISISDVIERIQALFARQSSFSFNRLLQSAGGRIEIIVSLLAVLELIKAQQVRVQQEHLFGEILIQRADEPVPAPGAQEPSEQ